MTLEEILNTVSKVMDVPKQGISGRGSVGAVRDARRMFVYLALQNRYTLTEVGRFLSGRHHTTILSLRYYAEDLLDTDAVFKRWHKLVNDYIAESYPNVV